MDESINLEGVHGTKRVASVHCRCGNGNNRHAAYEKVMRGLEVGEIKYSKKTKNYSFFEPTTRDRFEYFSSWFFVRSSVSDPMTRANLLRSR